MALVGGRQRDERTPNGRTGSWGAGSRHDMMHGMALGRGSEQGQGQALQSAVGESHVSMDTTISDYSCWRRCYW